MDVVAAYRDVGTYRGAAAMCGVDPKTVKRKVLAHEAGELDEERAERAPVPKNTDGVRGVVAERVGGERARISAKRLLPAARAAGYAGSAAELPAAGRRRRRAGRGGDRPSQRRPAVWTPGETLVIDWGTLPGGVQGVLRGGGVVAVPVRALRPRRDRRHDDGVAGRVLRDARRRAGQGARRSDGLLEGRRRGQRGDPDTGLRPVRDALPVLPGLLPSGRPGVEGHRRAPRRLREDATSSLPGRRDDLAVWNAGCRGVVRRGQRRRAHRDLRRSGRAARDGAAVVAGVAVAAAADRAGARCARSTSCRRCGWRRRATRSRTAWSAAGSRRSPSTGRCGSTTSTASSSPSTRSSAAGEASVLDEHYPTPRRAPSRGPTGTQRHRAGLPRSRRAGRSVHPRRRRRRHDDAAERDRRDRHRSAARPRPRRSSAGVDPSDPLRPVPGRRCALDPGHRPRRCPNRPRRRQRRRRSARRRGPLASTPTGSRAWHDPAAPPRRRCPPISRPA